MAARRLRSAERKEKFMTNKLPEVQRLIAFAAEVTRVRPILHLKHDLGFRFAEKVSIYLNKVITSCVMVEFNCRAFPYIANPTHHNNFHEKFDQSMNSDTNLVLVICSYERIQLYVTLKDEVEISPKTEVGAIISRKFNGKVVKDCVPITSKSVQTGTDLEENREKVAISHLHCSTQHENDKDKTVQKESDKCTSGTVENNVPCHYDVAVNRTIQKSRFNERVIFEAARKYLGYYSRVPDSYKHKSKLLLGVRLLSNGLPSNIESLKVLYFEWLQERGYSEAEIKQDLDDTYHMLQNERMMYLHLASTVSIKQSRVCESNEEEDKSSSSSSSSM